MKLYSQNKTDYLLIAYGLNCLEYDLQENIKQNIGLHRKDVVEPSPVAKKCLSLDYIRGLYRIDDDGDDIKAYVALLHYLLL